MIGRKGVEDFINISENDGLRISEELLNQFDKEAIRKKMMTLYADLIKNSQPALSPTLFPKEISWEVS